MSTQPIISVEVRISRTYESIISVARSETHPEVVLPTSSTERLTLDEVDDLHTAWERDWRDVRDSVVTKLNQLRADACTGHRDGKGHVTHDGDTCPVHEDVALRAMGLEH